MSVTLHQNTKIKVNHNNGVWTINSPSFDSVELGEKHPIVKSLRMQEINSRIPLSNLINEANKTLPYVNAVTSSTTLLDYSTRAFQQTQSQFDQIIDKFQPEILSEPKFGNGNLQLISHIDGFVDEFANTQLLPGGIQDSYTMSAMAIASPWNRNVEMGVDLTRLLCSNGLKVTAGKWTAQVPLLNSKSFDLDLRVAVTALFNETRKQIQQRLNLMMASPSSVYHVMKTHQIMVDRTQHNEGDASALQKLQALKDRLDIKNSVVGSSYSDAAFMNRKISEVTPTPISQYDLWNMITEASSHTQGFGGDWAIHRYAAELLLGGMAIDRHVAVDKSFLKDTPVDYGAILHAI